MTIVELYDNKPINNVVGILAFDPDKVIYVGGYSKKHFENKNLPVLKKYLNKKGYDSLITEYVQVRRDSLTDIVEKLESIYSENEDCRFHVEVTGGEDLILIGIGILCQRHSDIQLYQISSKLRTIRSFSPGSDDGTKLDISCFDSVEENLLLHGASIVHSNGDDHLSHKYIWGIEFLHDVKTMWNICCNGTEGHADPQATYHWNKITALLSFLEGENENMTDKNTLYVMKSIIESKLANDIDYDMFYRYICCFESCGLIDYREEPDYIILNFKNDQIRNCLTKAGVILELKTYLICCELLRGNNGDCLTSVTIDWDGDEDLTSTVKYLYDAEDPDSTISTINEVDVLATCGLVPYFISCKNGKFTADELYKLNSVGEQFGKGYSVKIIVATNIDFALGAAKNIILQRAADMGIIIIDNVHTMTDKEFKNALSKSMELPGSLLVSSV